MKSLLIVNPVSGTVKKDGILQGVSRRLDEAGWEFNVEFTQCRGDATRLGAYAVTNGYEAVITLGGDGTVNEAAASLCNTSIPLGIIPCGSGNGLARHIGMPQDWDKALDVIIQNHVVAIDYATVNDARAFFCTFGLGFDAAVSECFATKGRRGRISYLQSTLETFVKYHPDQYVISANGEVITENAFLVAVCNASQYGNNAYIAPEASVRDGLLDITIIHSGNPLTRALAGIDMLTGRLNQNMLINHLRTSHVNISRKNAGPAHIDGEPVEDLPCCVDIKCHPGGLNVFCPQGKEPFKPIITPLKAAVSDLQTTLRRLLR